MLPGVQQKQMGVPLHSLPGSTLPSLPRMHSCLSSSKDISSFTFGYQIVVSRGGWCGRCFGSRFQQRMVTSQLSWCAFA